MSDKHIIDGFPSKWPIPTPENAPKSVRVYESTPDYVKDMEAEIAALKGLLREVEFSSDPFGGGSHCPLCLGQTETRGSGIIGQNLAGKHSPDCRLAAALKEKP